VRPQSSGISCPDVVGWALSQGIAPEEIAESIVHLIAYRGFPAGLTALEIANDLIGSVKE
jgi:alkylhydroperoxidase/carboxymuconolactone decarboxylase family protein YurZ